VANDTSTKLLDLLPAFDRDQEQTVAEAESAAELCASVRSALAELDERERYIVEHRLMADAEDALTLAELGQQLGVSRERARQLEARAKRKLRSRFSELEQAEGSPRTDLGCAA